jgi:regulation of enolase protein 1 (concanavalin A-like superfamily)
MRWLLAMLAIGMSTTAASAQESLPIKLVTAIKDATVMILTHSDEPGEGGSGSGFLIRAEGQTGYIVTNQHVISGGEGRANGQSKIDVIIRSGARGQRKSAAEIVAVSAEQDLAILRISGVPDLPAAIDVLKETELVETMPIYVFGFPFGQALSLGRGSPSVVVGKGSVSSVRRDPDGKAWRVLIDGALNPGNSGGPVVDAQGRLVGVAVAAIRGANIGIAIAPPELLTMLAGRPDRLNIHGKATQAGTAELAVDIPLLDPLGQISAVTFLYLPDGKIRPAKPSRKNQPVVWAPLPGAKKLELKIEAHTAHGAIAMPTSDKDLNLAYQLAFVDGHGQTHHTKPGSYLLSAARAEQKPGGLTLWGDVTDPEDHCTIQVKNGGISLEVPGSHHDLNAEIGKYNAPRILQDVEGDFVVQVKVAGEFQPEEPSTREGAIPFNGAGLLIWLDADNFIRMERGAGLRNNKIGAFLLFECYQPGGRTTRNNARLDQGDVYLKIERHGNRIDGFSSTDGRDWTEAKPMNVAWPARVKVGLDAVNSAFSPFSVRFEEFSLRKLTDKSE